MKKQRTYHDLDLDCAQCGRKFNNCGCSKYGRAMGLKAAIAMWLVVIFTIAFAIHQISTIVGKHP